MHERVPLGVVTKHGDRYIGTCDELGITSVGDTVAEAFATLQVARWQYLAAHGQVATGLRADRCGC